MTEELNKLLTETNFDVSKDIANHIFHSIKADSQEELNIKAALLKQSFLNQFELQFEVGFLNASEDLIK